MTLLMEGTPEKSTGEAALHGPVDVPATRVRVFTGSAGSAVDERPFMPPTDTSEERPAYRAAGLTLLFRSHLLLIILNIGLVLAIFFLDVSIATDIAIGMLYVAPVAWMALWSSKHDTPLMVTTAVGCTVLSIVGWAPSSGRQSLDRVHQPYYGLFHDLVNDCPLDYTETRRGGNETSSQLSADLLLLQKNPGQHWLLGTHGGLHFRQFTGPLQSRHLS